MGFQECEDPQRVLAPVGLAKEYEAFQGAHAICMAYRKASWTLLEHGQADVAEDMPTRFYGKRGTQWMRLRHLESGATAFFANHHGPLSVNSGGICGGVSTAHNLLHLMSSKAQTGDLLILVGDFNANAASLTVQALWPHLTHVYSGDSFGGVDNVFSNADFGTVMEAKMLGSGGSDHNAISAVIQVGGGNPSTRGADAPPPQPSNAVAQLMGRGTSGLDWSNFWCGRMESDTEYVMEASVTALDPVGEHGDPDRCCRSCQQEPRCKAFMFYSHPPRCALLASSPVARKSSVGVTAGLPAAAAAAAAADEMKRLR